MRLRTAVVLLALAAPALASAQTRRRIPRTGTQRPPKELPPRAPGIKDSRYRSLRISVESYPLISFVQTDAYVSQTGKVNSMLGGIGTRVLYRLKPALSLAADLTGAAGNQFQMYSGDLGMRLMPTGDALAHPYLDARFSYGDIRNSFGYSDPLIVATPGYDASTISHGHGFGGVVGVGFETAITTRFAFSSGIAYAKHRMDAYQIGGSGRRDWDFNAQSVRFTVGVRYTPQRVVRE